MENRFYRENPDAFIRNTNHLKMVVPQRDGNHIWSDETRDPSRYMEIIVAEKEMERVYGHRESLAKGLITEHEFENLIGKTNMKSVFWCNSCKFWSNAEHNCDNCAFCGTDS